MSGGKLYNPIPLIWSAANYINSIEKCYQSFCTSYMTDCNTQQDDGINSSVLINPEIVIQNGNINESSPLLTAP